MSADPLSYTTNGSREDLVSLVSLALQKHVRNSSSNYPSEDNITKGIPRTNQGVRNLLIIYLLIIYD